MIKVLLDTSPLESGHAHRGIGSYTKNLKKFLQKNSGVKLVDSVEEADIIHYPFFDFFQATLPLLKKKPTVVTIHDVIPLQYPDYYPTGIKGFVKLQLQKVALATVSQVITDSQASQTQIQKHLTVSPNKISPVLLAADRNISYQSVSDQKKVAAKYTLPKKFILYVGDINYNKNIPGLLEAFSQVDEDLDLVMVGKNFRHQEIPEWERIQIALATYNLQDRVHLLNNIDSTSDLAAIYSQAEMYVQPSIAEGFGLPILEAMQCNTPVVCFKQSAMKEIGGEHIIFPEANTSESLAKKINEVYKMYPTERKKWILQAYSWSRTFTWQKTAQQTIDVYKKVLKVQ